MAIIKKGVWIDTTRKGEIESSELSVGSFRVSVHRHIHHDPDDWLMTSHGLFSCAICISKQLEHAKNEAAARLEWHLKEALNELENV